ncbi:bifunctional tRNA (5-methylaminomethyl-2-thiouridine)(34)-methyltransferase MnmD/FAD-dependent 5-carboxymethylaminomethyl-2-thiouridine(34) oxidoreductase MnmC [Marinobacter salinisoli]|uniref:tRNA 5-methylaminomethyl-2-thiouridine biosynthesis bifunctional protein MnmC n=1 Tax=Marinobacter salinisoli TaxID=2769486 RepID=A0ABX7MUU8_9GAMM|nr:bifunctional tRNA (5-methylaminomethyl-2-thiouridine)(34)-methyltransferase MnmD/FAD-dependent 5-carboxymethylaminomethyl-2-thiouridine(34) oxidoreductase MnmC [Marinobacter salinisoli]QSP94038.1 bifunctional tRNA (5-methylaminomethyl-2-thiouridine)(34)-methyltransferase MnmD/FAD-dependent 5-carboxymethylaminomethyl-2-thiouridine(34) oxidoreductase MnmC [Marinobacter salinisoli]
MHDNTLLPAIESAELIWRDGVPESARFGDVYFSRDNGLEETRYVFLQHNGLPDRFRAVPHRGNFVIAESGFGTGLNFLAAWQAWRDSAPDHAATFHFVSVERFPLTAADLKKALALWPELSELANQLLDAYPPLVQGTHRLIFDGGRVRLTLYFGDVLEAWNLLNFHADAWFLDGFAPSLNPEMWLEEAISLIRKHSKPGTTLATFTAVGRIRRALIDAGFTMSKQPGFGRKRDMLAGLLPGEAGRPGCHRQGAVAVIGAGIAGCLLARNLAERGLDVLLFDGAAEPASGASGNLQGASYVKLGVEFNDQTQLALSALLFSQHYYQPFTGRFWHPTGLLQLAWNPREADRQNRFIERNQYPADILRAVSRQEASTLTGLQTFSGGLWFPGSGWLQPGPLCRALADHPRIRAEFGANVSRCLRQGEQWLVETANNAQYETISVVLCCGDKTPELLPDGKRYRFKRIRGQVSHLDAETARLPNAVICGQKYLNPGHDGIAVTGATFDLHDDTPVPTTQGHLENLTNVGDMAHDLFQPDQVPERMAKEIQGRVAFRCTTHDYQPVAGPVADTRRDTVQTGLYTLTGLGSKGLTYAPLLAEYLADRLSEQPECLPQNLSRRLASERMIKN